MRIVRMGGAFPHSSYPIHPNILLFCLSNTKNAVYRVFKQREFRKSLNFKCLSYYNSFSL
jgi:hypothetical protein